MVTTPTTQTVPSGNNATFSCMVTGAPPSSDVMYQWMEEIDGMPLPIDGDTGERVSGTATSTLTIMNVGLQDIHTYVCIVSVDGVEVGSDTGSLNVSRECV